MYFAFMYACTAVSTLSSTKGSGDPREHYLGLLYPSEQYKVYPIIISLTLSLSLSLSHVMLPSKPFLHVLFLPDVAQ